MDPPLVILICIAKRYTVSDLCGKPKFTPCTQEVAISVYNAAFQQHCLYVKLHLRTQLNFSFSESLSFCWHIIRFFFILNLTIGLTVFLFVHVYVSLQSVKLL